MQLATAPYELTRLDPNTFEHLANQLAIATLGAGATGFAPGADGGRDGWFEGQADYPSTSQRWSGNWYIQSKFHAPHLSTDAQKWLQHAVNEELKAFASEDSDRVWPDNWIIVTNIDPSATPKSGTHDRVLAAVKKFNPELAKRTHIWGGQKVLALLAHHPEVAKYYSSFITSGQVLSSMMHMISDDSSTIDEIIKDLVVAQFIEQQFTKLEQAGSTADSRPGIHKLFVDLPYKTAGERSDEQALISLSKAAAESYVSRPKVAVDEKWERWSRLPNRSRIWFLRGGPGQGKSTLTQYICQIQRAAIIQAGGDALPVSLRVEETASEVETAAKRLGAWPTAARVPVQVELRLYAHWLGSRSPSQASGLITYLSERLSKSLEQKVLAKTLRRAFAQGRWIFVFDGLDEVPGDVKDDVAAEIMKFVDNTLIDCRCDALVICTSRPQGYSGQLDGLEPAFVDLAQLKPEEALQCAIPVLAVDRGPEELEAYASILREALSSPAIQEIMTTPLQSHIMAVVVRDGGRPPERRWQLFNNFYQVIKKREANRNLADKKLAKLLREGDKLIKNLHNRLGFHLHFKAEKSSGALTSLEQLELEVIVRKTVEELLDSDVEETVATLMEATTERLVLVSTPENASSVRFDIRPLQEFFAAEYLYENAPDDGFMERLQIIGGDSHWREVMHFLLSALVENGRKAELAQAVQVLTELDEPADVTQRPLARALCLGGAAVARLLREGVLESDKRVRHLFAPCLRPLLAATGARHLLPNVGPHHSREWLRSLVLVALREQSSSENIGAACLAAGLLRDSNSADLEILQTISENSASYRDAFISQLGNPYVHHNATEHRQWVYDYVLTELSRDTWKDLSKLSLDIIYAILGSSAAGTAAAIQRRGISASTAEVLSVVFSSVGVSPGSRNLQRKIGGLVNISVGAKSKTLSSANVKNALLGDLNQSTGLLRTMALVVLAGSTGDDEYLNLLADGSQMIGSETLLPAGLTHRYCGVASHYQDMLGRARVEEFIRKKNVGSQLLYSIESSAADQDIRWDEVVETFPSVLVMHFDRTFGNVSVESLVQWLELPLSLDKVARALNADSRSYLPTLDDAIQVERESPPLAEVIVRTISQSPVKIGHRIPGSRSLHLQSISRYFPSNPGVYPHVLLYLFRIYMEGYYAPKDEKGARLYTFSEVVSEFLDLDCIESVDPTGTWCDEATESALTVLRAVSVDVEVAHGMTPMIVDLIGKLPGSAVNIPGAFAYLTIKLSNGDQVAVDFVNRALQQTRDNFALRAALEPVLRQWREIARAPVTNHLNQKIWF
jgi:hypothetical protein